MPGSLEIATSEPATDANPISVGGWPVALATFAATVALAPVGLPDVGAVCLASIGITLLVDRRPAISLRPCRRHNDRPSADRCCPRARARCIDTSRRRVELVRHPPPSRLPRWRSRSASVLPLPALPGSTRPLWERLDSSAGGASGIVAMADDLGADSRLVCLSCSTSACSWSSSSRRLSPNYSSRTTTRAGCCGRNRWGNEPRW